MESRNSIIKTTASEQHLLDQSIRTDHLATIIDLDKINSSVEASIINAQNLKYDFFTSEFDEIIIPEQPIKINFGFSQEKSTVDFLNYSGSVQKWLCYIEEITENSFTAKMEDLNNPGTYEIGEFDFKEVAKDDYELLSVGAIFYCHAGFVIRNGQVIKESLIRFKRSINWSVSEFDSSVDAADDLLSNLNWD